MFLKDVSNFFSRTYLVSKPYIPTGMVVVGIGLMTVGAIRACMKTARNLEPVLDNHQKQMDAIAEKWAREQVRFENDPMGVPEYSEEIKTQESMTVYGGTIRELVKTFAEPVLEFTAGALLVATGFGLQYAAYGAAVAYGTKLNSQFNRYRQRVISTEGAEADKKYMYGVKKETIVETVVDPETGEEQVVTSEVESYDTDNLSMYSFVFDETNMNFDIRNPRGNLLFVKRREQVWTDKMIARSSGNSPGWITLNEMLIDSGFNPVKEGYRAGKLYFPNDPTWDNRVRVAILDTAFSREERLSNGEAPSTVLDWNCDGDILAIMEQRGYGWPSILKAAG